MTGSEALAIGTAVTTAESIRTIPGLFVMAGFVAFLSGWDELAKVFLTISMTTFCCFALLGVI